MALNLVVANEALTARALIDPEALPELELRGWVAVGACSDPSRSPLRTDAEAAADAAAESKRVSALLKSDAAPAPSRPSK